jgi:hypothetical protein
MERHDEKGSVNKSKSYAATQKRVGKLSGRLIKSVLKQPHQYTALW